MASITIRNIPDTTKDTLRIHAAQCGKSLESYIRHKLQEISRSKPDDDLDVMEVAKQYFGEENGIDLVLPKRSYTREIVTFDE